MSGLEWTANSMCIAESKLVQNFSGIYALRDLNLAGVNFDLNAQIFGQHPSVLNAIAHMQLCEQVRFR